MRSVESEQPGCAHDLGRLHKESGQYPQIGRILGYGGKRGAISTERSSGLTHEGASHHSFVSARVDSAGREGGPEDCKCQLRSRTESNGGTEIPAGWTGNFIAGDMRSGDRAWSVY